MSTDVAALRIADEPFLVATTIERCPKTMMIRELFMNAVEAAIRAPIGSQAIEVQAKILRRVYRGETLFDVLETFARLVAGGSGQFFDFVPGGRIILDELLHAHRSVVNDLLLIYWVAARERAYPLHRARRISIVVSLLGARASRRTQHAETDQ